MKKHFRIFFVLLVLCLGFLLFSSVKTNALGFTTSGFAWSISTQFGEDASTQAGLHWLSEQTNTYAMFGLSNDEGDFSNAKKYEPVTTQVILTDETLTKDKISNFPDVFYECELDIDELEPNTRYMYYVTDGNNRSDVYRFTTAPSDGSEFSFGYINDPQVYGTANSSNSNWTRWVKICDNFVENGNKAGTPINFIMGGGDMVNNGGDGGHWAMIFNNPHLLNMQYFSTCGNHEYNNAVNNYETFKSRFYECQYNNPDNGYPEAEYHDVTCFFKYGDTLFVSLASCENKQAQIPWLDNVLKNNPAQWIICVVHMNPLSTNSGATAREFVPTFDKYGVDLVLFGDEHVYKVYDNYNNFSQVGASESGTYYFEQVATSTYGNYREGTVSVSAKITVNERYIYIEMYDMNGGLVNSKTLSPRRPKSSERAEFNEEKFNKSIKVNVNQDKRNEATLVWDDMGYGNVTDIALKSGDRTLMSAFVSSTKFAYAKTTSLTPDIDYDAYVEYKLVDGTVKTVDLDFTTKLSIFGSLEGISYNDIAKGYSVLFKKMNLRDEVTGLKLYVNGEYVSDVEKTARKIFAPRETLTLPENLIELKTVVGDKEYLLAEFIYVNTVVTPTTYTITYNPDGGTCEKTEETFEENGEVTLPTPVKEGYEFLGWYEGEEKVETIGNKDYNLIAKWNKLETGTTDPEPTKPVAPVETKSGCNKGSIVSVLYTFLIMGAFFIIRKKH